MRLLISLSLLTIIILIARPSSETLINPSKVLRVNLGTEPVTLDSRLCMDYPSWCVLKMLHEGLLRVGPGREILPGIAESFSVSDDGRTYTFFLRSSFWSDGSPLTAADFERTWKEILNPSFPAPYAHLMNIISHAMDFKLGHCAQEDVGISALNDHTLEVHLQHPAPWFPDLVTHPLYYPHKKDTYNGPFLLKSWSHGAEFIAERNPLFWDAAKVEIESIHVSFIQDTNTEWMMYCSGELDLAGRPFSIGLPEEVLATGHQNLKIKSDRSPYLLLLNTKVKPLSNRKCRRALALAIDRSSIVKHVLFSSDSPATGLLPPGLAPEKVDFLSERFKGEAALLWAEGLRELGISQEELAPIHLCTNGSQRHVKILACVQEQWRNQLDLEVQICTRDWQVFLNEVSMGDYQVARMGWRADFNDPTALLEVFESASGEANFTAWEHPEYQGLLQQSRHEKDQLARSRLLAKAEALLMKEMPAIPVFFENQAFVCRPEVSGLVTQCSGGVDLRWAKLNESKEMQ